MPHGHHHAPKPKRPRHNNDGNDGQVTKQEIVANKQFAALRLAAVCPRCGADSPARVLGPTLAQQWWDTWVIGTQGTIRIVAHVVAGRDLRRKNRSGGRLDFWCTIKFRVSRLLLGLTSGATVEPEGEYTLPRIPRWVGDDIKVTEYGSQVHVRDVSSGVQDARNGQDNYRVIESMSFSKLHSSQALIIMTTNSDCDTHLVVVDVASSFTTGTLEINASGNLVFIVETVDNAPEGSRVVFAVQVDGTVTKLTSYPKELGLYYSDFTLATQLSFSLFSLFSEDTRDLSAKDCKRLGIKDFDVVPKWVGGKKLEIWGCGTSIEPLRTVYRIPAEKLDPPRPAVPVPYISSHIPPTLSGGGLVIELSENNRQLSVTVASTGHVVTLIDFLPPGWWLEPPRSRASFLW
ncbi:hypothetical protein Pelo_7610 [Pelomyxa schiedti]|nr:hypothetical protein Pelo_7610 [Pelomyxa schiedti]